MPKTAVAAALAVLILAAVTPTGSFRLCGHPPEAVKSTSTCGSRDKAKPDRQ